MASGKIESFIKYLQFEKRYSAHTVVSYKTDLNQFRDFLNAEFSGTPLQEAQHPLVRNWLIQLAGAKIDSRSINRKIASLRAYYKFLLREEVISSSPMQKIKVLKTKKRLPHFVKESDMNLILDQTQFENSLDGLRQQLILELFYGTGMRLSELIGLKDTRINLKDRTLKVLGKRNKERIIPFGESLVPIIEKYRKVRDVNIPTRGNDLLLVKDNGDRLYPMFVNRLIKKCLQLSSVDKKSPHTLRHTYATHLLNKGAEINAVKDLLGHSSLSATQVYTHNTVEKLKKTYDQAHPKA